MFRVSFRVQGLGSRGQCQGSGLGFRGQFQG